MSLTATYVRSTDNRFYKNPLIVFDEGFIVFDSSEPPELVLWIESLSDNPPTIIADILSRELMSPDSWTNLRSGIRALRTARDFREMRPATSFYFDLLRRIPPPSEHDGAFDRLPAEQLTYLDP